MILDALRDTNLFRPWFRDLETWRAWQVVLAAIFGLPMGDADVELFRAHTGRDRAPTSQAREAWLIVGRRGGKSRIAALVAVFLAAFREYDLAPGERGVVMVIAADRAQARVVLRYVVAFLEAVSMLARLVERRTAESIDLANGISIEIHTASYRTVRGRTVVVAVLDEVAFWRDAETSANPASEILGAIRPAMATVPGALLLAISSPYAQRGVFYERYARCFGKDGDTLVWQAPTIVMNPTVDRAEIERAYAEDDVAARAEYGAEFRSDLEDFVPREAIERVTVAGRLELPPQRDVARVAFVDPSGGRGDSMTLAIAHATRRSGRPVAVLDLLREVRPPFSPDAVVREFAATLRTYGLSRATGDRYAGEWVSESFRRYGIRYEASERSKSEIYLEFLPLVNTARVELLAVPRLTSQITALERRRARGGRDVVDHPPGGRDDVANTAAGALVLAAELRPRGGAHLAGADPRWLPAIEQLRENVRHPERFGLRPHPLFCAPSPSAFRRTVDLIPDDPIAAFRLATVCHAAGLLDAEDLAALLVEVRRSAFRLGWDRRFYTDPLDQELGTWSAFLAGAE
jgi:hypothetical protein